MREDRMEEFGQAVILYLVNHAKLDKTRMSPTAKRLFFRQMAEFTATERERYEINCNRLLRLSNVPVAQCKTLLQQGSTIALLCHMKMLTLLCNVIIWNLH
jgi:hypothetical protein